MNFRMIILLAIFVVAGMAFASYTNSIDSVNSFEECVDAGNLVMESSPRECKTPDGKNFVESVE